MPTIEEQLAARIDHAESYPFNRPACSYLFAGGMMRPLSDHAVRDRVPVIASGSNASPSRLGAKFGSGEVIPVTRAVLHDFAVVFAGHFTAYGAIPATLCPHRDTATEVWITWLTRDQLTVMHASEGVIATREAMQRYDYVELGGLDLRPMGFCKIERAGAYLSRRMLAPEGSPLRFAEVFAKGARLRAVSQRAVLRQAAALVDREATYDRFMARVLSGADARQALFRALSPYTIDRDDGWPNDSLPDGP